MNKDRQTEAAGGVGAGGGGVDIDEAIQDFVSEELRKNLRKQFSRKMKTLGELKGKLQKPSEEKMELRPLSSTKQVLKVTQF